jgi:hypothetical protein
MMRLLQHLPGSRRWRSALLLLCLAAVGSVQLAAATHWHPAAQPAVSFGTHAPEVPADGGPDHDGCLLCQVAAHAGGAAPPPAPWALVSVLETGVASTGTAEGGCLLYAPSHSWQGRAPPRA